MPLYLAYGPNMSTARLKKRRLAPEPRGTASLQGHAIRFHKRSTDGSGKADAHFTGEAGDVVHGVLFELSEADLVRLDAIEGDGYSREERAVQRPDGTSAKASVYLARPEYIDHALRPGRTTSSTSTPARASAGCQNPTPPPSRRSQPRRRSSPVRQTLHCPPERTDRTAPAPRGT